MRSALFLEDGYTQVVLTPENDFDKAALAAIETAGGALSIKRGEFYHCRGGWLREAYWGPARPESLMLIVARPEERESVVGVGQQRDTQP